MRLESRTCRPISSTEAESSSVAVATDCMLLEACSETPATWLDRLCAVSAGRGGGGEGGPRPAGRQGRGRNIRHDGADRAFEIIGKTNQLGAAACGLLPV